MGYVSFVKDCLVLGDEAKTLVEPFALNLGMDVYLPLGQGQGTAYQQLSQTLLAVLPKDCNPLELGSLAGCPDAKRPSRFVAEEKQQVCT